MSNLKLYVGVDWGATENHVAVSDPSGVVIARFVAQGPRGVLRGLRKHTSSMEEVGVALERADLYLVDVLMEEGCRVFVVNPKQVDRFRDRFSPAGAKDDRRDAWVLASSLRTDPEAFRAVTEASDDDKRLRFATREYHRLEARRTAVANAIYAATFRIYPVLAELAPAIPVWFFELLRHVVRLGSPTKVRRDVLTKVLSRVRKLSIDQVRDVLQASPGPSDVVVVEEVHARLRHLLDELELIARQQRDSKRRVKQLIHGMRAEPGEAKTDVDILLSMPGIGELTAGVLLGEAGRSFADRDRAHLRKLSGVAPVTFCTGKERQRRTYRVRRRLACNHRLQRALYLAAEKAYLNDDDMRARYRRWRDRGVNHGGAIRRLGDWMLAVLLAMLRQRTLYRVTSPSTV